MALVAAACGDSDPDPQAAPAAQTATTAPTTTAPDPTDDDTGHDRNTTTAPTTTAGDSAVDHDGPVIEITVGADQQRHAVSLGDSVMIVVTGDSTDEVHVHGYDLTADVVPGAPAVLVLTADIPGVFEIELHGSGALLAELEVR